MARSIASAAHLAARSVPKIAAQLRKIRDERAKISKELGKDDTVKLDAGRENLLRMLDLLDHPQALYREASPKTRQVMNRQFFSQVHLDADDDGPFVASDVPTELVAPFVDVSRDPDGHRDHRNDDGGLVQSDEAAIRANALRAALRGTGLNSAVLVEVPGIEPGSIGEGTGLLRA